MYCLCGAIRESMEWAEVICFKRTGVKPIKISTEASRSGLGAVLQQQHGENWCPVAYTSRSVTDCESKYGTIKLETFGVTCACQTFYQYIYMVKTLK